MTRDNRVRSRPTAGQVVQARLAAGQAVPRWELHPRRPPVRSRRPVKTPTPARAPRWQPIGRGLAVAAAVGVLTVSGLAWSGAVRAARGFSTSDALGTAPHRAGAAETILLMGLDTRRDQNGEPLPPIVLHHLHAGDGDVGGYNTNSLILVHIPADHKNLVAFSIPRDDYVAVNGLGVEKIKIKEAYGRRKAQAEDELHAQGVDDPKELERRGREAGRKETLHAVRALTGVPIDRFAEVSLAGFYDLANSLDGVTVCLNSPVRDRYSGAHFPAGEQKLNGAQALAFVRQRHGLPNGDLDRTHRQQAFLLSVLHQLKQMGTLANTDRLGAVVSVAQRNVVLSSGWNLLDWAESMSDLSAKSISFRTLPVARYATVGGQDVNIVDPALIRTTVERAFGVPVTNPAESQVTTSSTDSASTTDTPEATPGSGTGSGSEGSAPPPDVGTAVTNRSGVPCVA